VKHLVTFQLHLLLVNNNRILFFAYSLQKFYTCTFSRTAITCIPSHLEMADRPVPKTVAMGLIKLAADGRIASINHPNPTGEVSARKIADKEGVES
jgi:hypothetical protein